MQQCVHTVPALKYHYFRRFFTYSVKRKKADGPPHLFEGRGLRAAGLLAYKRFYLSYGVF